MRETIHALAHRYHGEWEAMTEALRRGEKPPAIPGDEQFVTWADPHYPARLRQLRFPPWILFYRGNLSLASCPSVGIVGSRKAVARGLQATEQVCLRLREKVVVSGLAAGIDGCAHRSALRSGGRTIGIAGCGLKRPYPLSNRDLYEPQSCRQLILSEYPGFTAPLRHHFPWRNRLIAAAGSALVVIEAVPRSGTMHTVSEALELSRPVYCLSRSFLERIYTGNALLIQQGAAIVLDEDDVKEI